MKQKPQNIKTRLLNRIRINPNGCWEWTGAKDQDGYGLLKVSGSIMRRPKKAMFRAHRMAAIFLGNKRITGKLVCHTCDNPPCINPDHLFVGTQKDNVRDMDQKGRRVKRFGRLESWRILDMRKQYNRTVITFKQLGEEHGVSTALVQHIIQRRIYKHIP